VKVASCLPCHFLLQVKLPRSPTLSSPSKTTQVSNYFSWARFWSFYIVLSILVTGHLQCLCCQSLSDCFPKQFSIILKPGKKARLKCHFHQGH
jgi:hypothetical protein